MAYISRDQVVLTLINVFTVVPEQLCLADALIEATETVINKLPGFVSANIHKSLDGTRVTNYAQWENRGAFEAMLGNPDTQAHLHKAEQIATMFEPHLYEVSFVDEAHAA